MQSAKRNELMNKLQKCNEYKRLRTNNERINFILENMIQLDDLQSLIEAEIQNSRENNGKNLVMAKNLKIVADYYLQQASLGHIHDKSSNVNRALKYYTRAILYMPLLQDLPMATRLYARKCQCHLQLDEMNAALYSIRIALDLCDTYGRQQSIPFAVRLKYRIMEINCLKSLSRYNEAYELIDLMIAELSDHPSADEYEQFISIDELERMKQNLALQMSAKDNEPNDNESMDENYFSYRLDQRCTIRQSPIVGRHFIAREDIDEKTRILEERPYSIVIESDYLHRKCSNCFRDLKYRIYPCLYCTEVLFCNRKCFEETYNLYHRHECGLISLLKSLTSASVHVFRMVSRITPMIAYEIERENHELKDYCIDDYLREDNQRLLREMDKDLPQKSRAYKMSSILWDHNSKHSEWANVQHVVIGMETAMLLAIVHKLPLNNHRKEFIIDFIDMIIVDIRRIIFNVFGWHEYNADWSLRGHIANCQCLVGSLINHSCVPNTNWEFKDGRIRFTTNRFIRKGEEITITYGPNKDMPYDKRQERLNHYFFGCHCPVCVADARKGYALRCIQCDNDGPVPFGSSMDLEPVLKGQCLTCFQKYPSFDENVQKYQNYRKQLRQLEQLIRVQSSDLILVKKAIETMKNLAQISIIPNPKLNRSFNVFTRIFKHFRLQPSIDSGELMEIGSIIDTILPDVIIDNDDFDELFTNIHYWYRQMCSNSSIIRNDDSNNYNGEALMNILNNLKQRLNQIMNIWNEQYKNNEMSNNNNGHHWWMMANINRNIIETIRNDLSVK